jgi:hypothetical protein
LTPWKFSIGNEYRMAHRKKIIWLSNDICRNIRMEHCWHLYDKLRFEEKGHTGCKTFEINLLNIVQKLVYNDDYGGCIFQLCLNLNLGVPELPHKSMVTPLMWPNVEMKYHKLT